MIRSIRSKNKLELFIANWSYSYNLKRVFSTYQRMRVNRTSWAGTRRKPNTAGLTFSPELRGSKMRTYICWNSFQTPPSKLLYSSKSSLKHIQLIHHFLSSNYFHTIEFWDFLVWIKNLKIIRKITFTCQTFWWCCLE